MNTEYVSMKAGQLDRHQKVFTRWINLQLAKANPPIEVSDLINEVKDGQILLTLVEVLLGIKVSRETKKNRISYIKNVQEAMRHLARNKVQTAGVIASEIVAGVQRATLSLLWSIILQFQVTKVIQLSPGDYEVDRKLLIWCQDRLKGYREKVHVIDLASSWIDGLAFNALLHSFNPSLFDFDAISAGESEKRLTHAFNLATTTYGVPSLFETKDIGSDTPDKNMITLFLSYLYQFVEKGTGSVEIVKKDAALAEVTRREYKVETSSTRYESSRSGGATYDVKKTTTTHEEKNDGVFFDSNTGNEAAGQERVLHVYGFPSEIQISEELKEEPLRFTSSPQTSANYAYSTVTTIQRSITTTDGHVTSTQTTNTVSSKDALGATKGKTEKDKKALQALETDGATVTEVKKEKRKYMTVDGGGGKENVSKEQEAGKKPVSRTKDETVTPEKKSKDEELNKAKTPVAKISTGSRDVLLVSTERISGGSTPKRTKPPGSPSWRSISSEENDGPASDVSPAQYFQYSKDDSTSPRYLTQIEINLEGERENIGSTSFVDHLKRKLDGVDQRLFDLEYSSKHSDKDSMDLKTTKNALDQHKEILFELESVESQTYDVLEEGRNLVNEKYFDHPHEEYFSDRMDATEGKLKRLEDNLNKEHQRLFDLYIILLKQHLERMNDWLVRAESRMALDDDVEPTHAGVQLQVTNHQTFQEDLANHSMVNMILDMDLEDPAIDETIRDWVKVLSERWAAVWTWAEEWKEKLNQALLDWNKLREEETVLLSWLSSKEQTMDVIGQTDITDEEQVKMHLNLLETLEREMETQGTRLESLHETGEQLIKDADYHNSTAKGIRDQLEDFDGCWEEITNSVKERKAMLQDAQSKVKQMGNLMREVRTWLDDAENFIKFLSGQNDPQKENKIQEKIELKCEEKDRNQIKVDEIKSLEDSLGKNIDKTSNHYMKRVTKPFHKRWNDAKIALDRYHNEDYPFVKPDDCFLFKCFKKALVVN
ncbi:dystrophin-like isoform X3 [Oculina patagonica]